MRNTHALYVVSALLAVASLVWFGTSATGAFTMYEHRDNPYVSFSENLCGEGMQPILVQETRWGTGKTNLVGCVEAGTTIHSSSVPFPPLSQRYRQPLLRIIYYYSY